MPTLRISEMPAAASLTGTEKFEVTQAGSTKAATALQLRTFMGVVTDSLTTTTTAAGQIVSTVVAADVRCVKYVVQVTSGSAYQVTEILVLHDGTTAYVTEYATVTTGTNLAAFTADVSSGNLRLLVTPTNANTTIKARGTTIPV